jgi:Adenosylmethionine-8-amino-7-oxononanoate aminotransferase
LASSITKRAEGHYWHIRWEGITGEDKIIDSCDGAGVACIGHGIEQTIEGATEQMNKVSYVSHTYSIAQPV